MYRGVFVSLGLGLRNYDWLGCERPWSILGNQPFPKENILTPGGFDLA